MEAGIQAAMETAAMALQGHPPVGMEVCYPAGASEDEVVWMLASFDFGFKATLALLVGEVALAEDEAAAEADGERDLVLGQPGPREPC
jgi:hypothetical protein